MTDRREEILARLAEIAPRIKNISVAQRMTRDVNTEEGPAIILFDGSEQIINDERKDGRVSQVFAMRPELLVYLQASAADVGKNLNKIRAAAIDAVVFDEELRSLAGGNGKVRYLGCETSAERGRAVEADMALIFEITYVLQPQLLRS
jgi:hypothetical protein